MSRLASFLAASFLAATVATTLASTARAEDFYVDPESGSPDGDGSAADPWRTLEEVWEAGLVETRHWSSLPYDSGSTLETVNAGAPVKAGDTIWLRSGYHGAVEIQGAYNESPITIAAEAGETPQLSRIMLRAASNWVVRGVSISPSYAPTYEARTMVDIDNHGWHGPSHDIVIEGCEMFSVDDTSGWSAGDWVDMAANGVQVDGDDVTVRDNELRNVRFGISVGGENALIARNVIDSFSGDGLRGLGDYGQFIGNLVKNCYDVDANHDDGFQSWSNGEGGVGTGEVRGIVLRGNVIINYEDPDQPHRGTLQGIGCFDGFFVDWVVENNVIVTDHWHGITLLGSRGSRIVNNTVLDLNTERPGPPWIRIAAHKNGTPSEDNLVRNNLTTALSLGDGVTEDHNQIIEDASALFVDPAGGDFHLLPGAAAVDVGIEDMAPATDIEGIPRPQGAAVDLGAYEWHEPGVAPVDAGAPDPDAGAGGGSDGGTGGGVDGGAGGGVDGGGTGPSPDGSTGPGADPVDAMATGGCGCRVASPATPTPLGPALLGLVPLVWLARRRVRDRRAARRRG